MARNYIVLIVTAGFISCLSLLHREFADFCARSQQSIISSLESVDKNVRFLQEPWKKDEGSYGITAVLSGGDVWEKAAVSTTIANGILSKERASSISSKGKFATVGDKYSAAALSLVLHSRSPLVPTFRADVRYFETGDSAWFGGGADLTPYILFEEDAVEFHKSYYSLCNRHSDDLYPRFKQWCDDYFFIPARGEHRGIGGIFFDDLDAIRTTTGTATSDIKAAQEFTEDVCLNFMPSYLPIVERRATLPYTEKQRHFQLLRRGRYVEFNLLYDRGVKFGLVPGGRTEAVLVSCPPLVAWDYKHPIELGGEEDRLMQVLQTPRDWLV